MAHDRRTDQDHEDFARAMADVVPLVPDPRGRVGRRAPAAGTRPLEQAPLEPGPVPDDYAGHGVDRREIRKLRRGQHTVSGRLDLHGMTVAEAVKHVGRFIEQSRHARHRCVCIIHGKGLNSPGGMSQLKSPVRETLMRTASVLAFTSAPSSDGGGGAVYVLLRK